MYLGPYQRPAQLHSATAQQSPQGSSMKGLCAVVGIGTTAVLHSGINRTHDICFFFKCHEDLRVGSSVCELDQCKTTKNEGRSILGHPA